MTDYGSKASFSLIGDLKTIQLSDLLQKGLDIGSADEHNKLINAHRFGAFEQATKRDRHSMKDRASRHSSEDFKPLFFSTATAFQTEIAMGRWVGRGSSAVVYQALWKDQQVAVKLFHMREQSSHVAQNRLRKEAEIMSTLKDHRGVITMLGACLHPPHMCIIMEHAKGGSLWSLIHQSGKQGLSPRRVLQVAKDLALALMFCHSQSPAIIHGDVNPKNVLLDSNGRAVLADFGMAAAAAVAAEQHANTPQRVPGGTVAYMAPELFRGGQLTVQSDAYAFAVLLWECISGQQAWKHLSDPGQIAVAVCEGERPSLLLSSIQQGQSSKGQLIRGQGQLCCHWTKFQNRDAEWLARSAEDEALAKLESLISWCWNDGPGQRPQCFWDVFLWLDAEPS